MDIFLDYYHPYAGLCNQLYLITNHLVDAINLNKKIYINKVNIDIFKKNRINACDFFDLVKTSENIKKLTGKDIILFEKPINFTIPKLCIYPVNSIEILNCLEFQEKFLNLSLSVKEFNAIHFRLELDAIIHYLFSTKVYDDFMNKCNNNSLSKDFIKKFMELSEVKDYINFLLKQYFDFILKISNNASSWYICTLIGKKEIHDCLLPILKMLTDFIESLNGNIIKNEQYFEERELNALVDLLNLRDCTKMIGFEGSSYSEGYAYKVNSIRNCVKEYYFVNGIVNKISDELYESC